MESRGEIVLKEWNKFCTTSSVRGLKRPLISSTRGLRIYWILFLLAAIGITFLQMYNVMNTYLKLRDSTALRTRIKPNSPQIFPSISICRKDPYKGPDVVIDRMNSYNASVTSPESYNLLLRQNLLKIMETEGQTEEMMSFAAIMNAMWDTVSGFNAQIPKEAINEVSSPINDWTVYVVATYRNESTNVLLMNTTTLSISDNQTGFIDPRFNVKTFYHPQYLLCQTVNLNFNDKDLRELKSLELLLWDPPSSFKTDTNSSFNRAFAMQGFGFSDGIIIALHSRGIYGSAALEDESFLLKPGTLSELMFETTVTNYLECGERNLNQGNLGTYKYNAIHCRMLAKDRDYREQCNCTYDPLSWDKPHCLHLPKSRENEVAKKFSDCQSNLVQTEEDCNRHACTVIDYETTLTSSEWIINDFQWKWFWELFVDYLKGMDRYLRSSALPIENRTALINKPMFDFDKLKGSLSSVKIIRKTTASKESTEVQLTSLSVLLSSMGGALSMYMGITVTVGAEFIEFIVLLVLHMRGRKQLDSNQSSAAENKYRVDK